MLIDKEIYRFVPPHNFDQFFIHDCFELNEEYFQEYPRSRGMVTSRNIPERVPFKWLKAVYTHLHETSRMSAEFVFRYGPKCM